jgi:DNA-binding winged helix-turn-helix (wHTH) protein
LTYLVGHAGRLVTQDEIFEALWSETYVNPEVLRKYILGIRKALGDRPDKPEFVEILPKRGYRFIAPVVEDSTVEPPDPPSASAKAESAVSPIIGYPTASSERDSPDRRRLWKFAIILIVAIVAAAAIAKYLRIARQRASATSRNNTSIAVLPFSDMSPGQIPRVFFQIGSPNN